MRPIQRALISVSDKTGVVELAQALSEMGVALISTGGTRRALLEAGLDVREVSDVTGFPEMLDGRVKTLHPHVHGGILAMRGNPAHDNALSKHGIEPIDLVVCNLYPFEQTVAREGSTHEEIIENVDIGGPTLIRSAAKNYRDVAVLCDRKQYGPVIEEMRSQGGLTLETRERLAAEAFDLVARYDCAIRDYFAQRTSTEDEHDFAASIDLRFQLRSKLRYGENPHQKGAFYVEPNPPALSLATAEVLHGKELSFNNLLDLDSALRLVFEFNEPAAVVLKHNNPCGAAVAATLETAFRNAYEGDPLSAYGSVLGFNREVDESTAMQITEPNRFVECILAPGYSARALEVLTTRPTWKKSVRLLRTGSAGPARGGWDYRRVEGGLLLQSRDASEDELRELKIVTKRGPTEQEMSDLRFGWLVCKHVKSNAIVLAKDGMIVGVGAGQMSRVDSVHLATRKAGERKNGAVLASDAFFPFRDAINAAADAGVTAIIQPGGAKRDQDSIDACNEHGLAMVATGVRHFRH